MQIFAVTGTLDEQREKIVELARNGYSEANIYIASNAVSSPLVEKLPRRYPLDLA